MLTEDQELAENLELAEKMARHVFNRDGGVGALLLFKSDEVAVVENFCNWNNNDERLARLLSAREMFAREADISHYAVVAVAWACVPPKDGAPPVRASRRPDPIEVVHIVAVARHGGNLSRIYKIIKEGDKARLERWPEMDGELGDGLTERLFPPTPTTRH
jgi:hypothetical protein